ncbi:hypothetical protein A7A08_01869 [Methyloligella halotolerans]|uniref:DUF2147 domain-containing protein n=1 Tax=Methyloligella halotolerans TaxID=1177755 RepID=A0A1E2RY19_9HYPH|nr:DUF2147 domain-containing protein [Methyloligella halotolerans]ODA67123.1 hypothetical protein A7A08_01869 [Methyloligella halotolerans]
MRSPRQIGLVTAVWLFTFVLFAFGPAIAQSGPDVSGTWIRGDGNAHVRIAECGESLCATNVWIGDTSKGEEVGDKLIMTLQPKSDTTLAGQAYDPKRGLTFSMTIKTVSSGLTTRGCVVGGIICKSASWSPAR